VYRKFWAHPNCRSFGAIEHMKLTTCFVYNDVLGIKSDTRIGIKIIPATLAITPSSASTSLTRVPLPTPPIDGLHDISPIVSSFCVMRRVRAPDRAAPAAASHPAWPPPITHTSHTDQNNARLVSASFLKNIEDGRTVKIKCLAACREGSRSSMCCQIPQIIGLPPCRSRSSPDLYCCAQHGGRKLRLGTESQPWNVWNGKQWQSMFEIYTGSYLKTPSRILVSDAHADRCNFHAVPSLN